MRDHDILAFSSNALDGWGAVVSEALEEGMRVIGTRETGAAAAMLPESCLYSCGDWRELEKKLQVGLPYVGIGNWTAAGAAERLGLVGNLI